MPADDAPSFFQTAKAPVFHSLSQCARCEISGEDFLSANVEAFEATGELYCDDCASDVLAELADEDEDDFIDCSVEALVREHGFYV